MKKFITAALAAGGTVFAFGALAQMNDMYTTGTGSNMMVMGGNMGDKGAPIAMSKDKCQKGGYYMSGDKMVTACAGSGMSYDLSMPAQGAMMSGNMAYPKDAMMMKEHKM